MAYLVLAIAVFIADFAFKRYMETHLEEGGTEKEAAGGKAVLRLCRNRGSAGGFFQDHTDAVKLISSAILGCAAVRFLILLGSRGRHLLKGGYALVLGGGMGNLVDRWMHGYVTDFFSFRTKKLKKIGQLVFNFADLFIIAGSLLLLLYSVFHHDRK